MDEGILTRVMITISPSVSAMGSDNPLLFAYDDEPLRVEHVERTLTRLERVGVAVGVALELERASTRRFAVLVFGLLSSKASFIFRFVAGRTTPMSSLRSVTSEAESSTSSFSFSRGESVIP